MNEWMNENLSPLKTELGPIHVEVLRNSKGLLQRYAVEDAVRKFLQSQVVIHNGYSFEKCHFRDVELIENVEKITVCATRLPTDQGMMTKANFMDACRIYVYRANYEEPLLEELESGDDDSKDTTAAGRHWMLPNMEFEGLWENLVFDSSVKDDILSYVETLLLFAKRNVDPHVVTCNRMLLFHGPPGTGKTTLCKAIAQKLCIRMGDHYQAGRFLEINSHSLFSKWFSESGKLVTKMFSAIHEMLENRSMLLIILIDEVESLTIARRQALSGNEPSDAVRVVNALLTQIDFLRRWPNVLVLTTSNIADAVDPAFLDRADIKQYIGPPSTGAIYRIFYESIIELSRTGIIQADAALLASHISGVGSDDQKFGKLSKQLLDVAKLCDGYSGRTIRKLPLLAHAYKFGTRVNITLELFINALAFAVKKHREDENTNSENGLLTNGAKNGVSME